MIELQNVSKVYQTKSGAVPAVQNVSLKIEKGAVFGIIGLSGAGKSTLVRCLNFLERPSEGKVIFNGAELGSLTKKQLLKTRQSMSMIFQGFNLLAQRTALKNVCYPLEISGTPRAKAAHKAKKLLELVGLGERLNAYPAQLSGGQKQRVAIARALATDPQVLLCDEATSALDPNTTRSILALLKEINQTLGVTIIVITHEMRVVEQICNRVAVMDGGKVVETGLVRDVFLAPQSQTARDLILPGVSLTPAAHGPRVIRVVFDGQSSFEPVIANLILECRTSVNILGADTKNLEGKAYGQMLLQLPETEPEQQRITDYLTLHHIKFEEVAQ